MCKWSVTQPAHLSYSKTNSLSHRAVSVHRSAQGDERSGGREKTPPTSPLQVFVPLQVSSKIALACSGCRRDLLTRLCETKRGATKAVETQQEWAHVYACECLFESETHIKKGERVKPKTVVPFAFNPRISKRKLDATLWKQRIWGFWQRGNPPGGNEKKRAF